MNVQNVKSLMLRDKQFLKELYSGPNPLKNKRVLKSASDTELVTLVKVLHYIVIGQIKILKEHFENLKAKKKLKLLRNKFEKKNDLKIFLSSSRENKINILIQLSSLYPDLLYCLFNLV